MSSTNRGEPRAVLDYYRTPQSTINDFLDVFYLNRPFIKIRTILDPCAGGDGTHPMPYPRALRRKDHTLRVDTMDIRSASPAGIIDDFLTHDFQSMRYDAIISNPPYLLAQEFVEKSMRLLVPHGLCVFLLRINFLGSQKRTAFWKAYPLTELIVHSRRPSFTGGGNDSTEYAHFVWSADKSSRPVVRVI